MDLNIRITHRTECSGNAVEHTFEIEPRGGAPLSPRIAQEFATEIVNGRVPATAIGRFEKHFDGDQHVATTDHHTGLMWSVESLGDADGDGLSQQACADRCAALALLGHRDWRLPTRSELVSLIDDTRHKPAIDTDFFPRVRPNWHWTSTAAAWSSSAAWGVDFNLGGVYYDLRDYDGFALAVRRAGQ